MPRLTQNTSLNRRNFIAAGSATCALAAQSGLGFAQTSDALHKTIAAHVVRLTAGEKPTLSLLAPQGSEGNLAPVIEAFFEMTGVKIDVTLAPVDDLASELLLDSMSDEHRFDIALPATFSLPDLVTSGLLRPVSDFVSTYEPEGFRNDCLYTVGDKFDGQTYGLQADGDAYMMFYNKGMLEDPAEIQAYENRYNATLKIPETWAELDQQMQFFHRPEAGQYGGLLFRTPGYLAWEWWVRFHAKGVWPLSEDLAPQINGPEGVAALSEMINASMHLHPSSTENHLFENWERFSQGDIYCNIGWGGTQKHLNSYNSLMRGKLVYGTTPGGLLDAAHITTPYFNWGWSYVVLSKTKFAEISYLFTLFAASPVMSTLAVRQSNGFFDPIRVEHYDDPGIVAAYSEEFLKVHRESLRAAIPDLYLKNQGEYLRILGRELEQAIAGKKPPQEALDRVARYWRKITFVAGHKQQRKRWLELRAKYPEPARSMLRDLYDS